MMAGEKVSNDKWPPGHLLFRSGSFFLPEADSQGHIQIKGYYNPVIDSIYLNSVDEEVVKHETTHRVFTIFAGGLWALRELAGINYSLLYFLTHTVDEQGGRLAGRKLGDLRLVHPRSDDHWVKTIVARMKWIEDIFDMCYWSLVPPAEIAAIDFMPGEEKYGWLPEGSSNVAENQKRKRQQIGEVAALLAQIESGWRHQYDNIQAELLGVWDAYTSIENNRIRESLLRLVMSAILRDSQDRYIAENTLEYMNKLLPYAQQPEAEELLGKMALEKFDETTDILNEIREHALGDIPLEFRTPMNIPATIDGLMLRSVPVSSNPVLANLSPENAASASNPLYSLLVFWVEPDGQPCVSINPGYRQILEQQLMAELPTLEKEWWRVAALFESLRQALKYGEPVVCPFQSWEGVDCHEQCPIRIALTDFQKFTELTAKGAVCPV